MRRTYQVDGMLFPLFYKRCTGNTRDYIAEAPPPMLLKAFGGHMDIEEYRDIVEQAAYTILPPKMILQSQVVHEQRIHDRRTAALPGPDLDIEVDLAPSTEVASVALKLKRPKPVNPKKQSFFEKIITASGAGIHNSTSKT